MVFLGVLIKLQNEFDSRCSHSKGNRMNKILFMFFLTSLTSCLGGKTDSQIREENKFSAQRWVQEIKVEGTVLCNHSSAFLCDFYPKEKWPPVPLFCHDGDCQLAAGGN